MIIKVTKMIISYNYDYYKSFERKLFIKVIVLLVAKPANGGSGSLRFDFLPRAFTTFATGVPRPHSPS